MTFEEYLAEVDRVYLLWSGGSKSGGSNPWRLGQTYFNLLMEVRPDLAMRLTLDGDRNDLDPFNSDKRIPMFLEWLEAEWNVGSQRPLDGTVIG